MRFSGVDDDKRVADLDPLAADGIMARVPEWNATGNIDQLVSTLRSFCNGAVLSKRTYEEVLAITRDMGILIGSIRRQGKEPALLVPEIESILLTAGALTELVPRDTLMHYTVWNPPGTRLRTYTDNPQESELIKSIQIALPAIRNATRLLFEMRAQPLRDLSGVQKGDHIALTMKEFLSGLHHALRHVEPEVFIRHFRPYYESIIVGEKEYRGPGAVTMPLHVFDYLLWGSSESDPRYQKFTADYLPYNLPEFRMYILRARNEPSFLDRVEMEVSSAANSVSYLSLLSAIGLWMKRVRGFRNAHRKYAHRAYHGHTPHSFATGSGGHTTSDLQWLSELTDKHALRFEDIRERAVALERSANKIAA